MESTSLAPSPESGSRKIRLFYSYAHEDEELRDLLEGHLSAFQHSGLIEGWKDRQIPPGTDWDEQIDESLERTDVILLLVSSFFLASKYAWGKEVKRAMERHEAGTACVIPVILRPVFWEGLPFSKLQALPKDGKPVTQWPTVHDGFYDVALGIRRTVEELRGHVDYRQGLDDPRAFRHLCAGIREQAPSPVRTPNPPMPPPSEETRTPPRRLMPLSIIAAVGIFLAGVWMTKDLFLGRSGGWTTVYEDDLTSNQALEHATLARGQYAGPGAFVPTPDLGLRMAGVHTQSVAWFDCALPESFELSVDVMVEQKGPQPAIWLKGPGYGLSRNAGLVLAVVGDTRLSLTQNGSPVGPGEAALPAALELKRWYDLNVKVARDRIEVSWDGARHTWPLGEPPVDTLASWVGLGAIGGGTGRDPGNAVVYRGLALKVPDGWGKESCEDIQKILDPPQGEAMEIEGREEVERFDSRWRDRWHVLLHPEALLDDGGGLALGHKGFGNPTPILWKRAPLGNPMIAELSLSYVVLADSVNFWVFLGEASAGATAVDDEAARAEPDRGWAFAFPDGSGDVTLRWLESKPFGEDLWSRVNERPPVRTIAYFAPINGRQYKLRIERMNGIIRFFSNGGLLFETKDLLDSQQFVWVGIGKFYGEAVLHQVSFKGSIAESGDQLEQSAILDPVNAQRDEPAQKSVESHQSAEKAQKGELTNTSAESLASLGLEWILIPGGTFLMGSDEDAFRNPLPDLSAAPPHKVRLDSFEITKTEVTVGQYRRCVDAGRCTRPSGGCTYDEGADKLPVTCVSWFQAMDFASFVGQDVRLPSEAEWEYAARSRGKDRLYTWASEVSPNCDLAVMKDCGSKKPKEVCSKPKGNTEQGLCDMLGNVWEYTLTRVAPYPGDGETQKNPGLDQDRNPEDRSMMVIRGGHFSTSARHLTTVMRSQDFIDNPNSLSGFRLVRRPAG